MPRITIILPLYKADIRCLEDCISSLENQTLKDFQCVFVNDGSPTSDCVDYAKKRTAGDARFSLVEKKNGGLATARNFGLTYAKAPYITFIDQDDLLHPQRFEAAVAALEKTGAEVCECKVLRPTFESSYAATQYPTYKIEEVVGNAKVLAGDEILNWYLAQKMNITVWSHVFKTELLVQNPLPESIWGCDDLAYSLVNADRIDKLVKIVEPLYFWRLNPSATTSKVPVAYINGVLQAMEYVLTYYSAQNLTEERGSILRNYLAGAFEDVMRDTLQVARLEEEVARILAIAKRTNEVFDGRIVDFVSARSARWLQPLCTGNFAEAVVDCQRDAKERVWTARKSRIKKFIKRLMGRK